MKKTTFAFFAIFACFTTSSSRSIFGQTEMDFKNPREVFSQHGLKNKNLSQFLQRSYEQGESKTSSRPIFPDFQFSVTVPILQELLRPAGDEFGETEGGFLSRTCPYTITSFIFLPGVIIQEKNTSSRTPFSQKTGPSFMAESSKFCGSGGYFWPRRLNRLSKLDEETSPIYRDDF
jgi:hypothetical protein